MARRPQRAAGGGDGKPRRRRSEGLGRRLAGLGGPLGRGEAVPEVGWSRGRAEEGSPREQTAGGGALMALGVGKWSSSSTGARGN